uniref:Uncharacterized mitochondrial protein AtMg00810-like n=1 Tax=Tanacetum cinerariifolium TaxID=118510 RepID=A0A699GSU2_TANCI|nr:uncharacterized mitochondrial protein AtMg00810-like [Tanacetum cinerariifolium]
MDVKDKLDLDQIGTPVDTMKYRSMIGALMYLTSSRSDIVHATYVCARYQAHPTEKHFKEVKRIFRYLRGTINMGLWYTKDSGFELTGFLDADYAGCKDTFKSTSVLWIHGTTLDQPTVTPYGDIRCDDGNPSRANIKQALEKVSNEQVARDLLTLQTPKKVSLAEQYIFQRRNPASSEPSGHVESPSIYAELGLTDSDSKSDEEVPPVVKVRAQDKGQAGTKPGVLTKGRAGSNPGDDTGPQPQSSHVVHAGPNLEHIDLETTDENLKPTVKEQVILEEPASSTGTLSSLQHLAKDFRFGDLFFNDKPSKAENEKTTAKTEVESMVSVIIQQDTSVIPPMTTPVIDLTSRLDSPNVHRPLQATKTKTTMTTITTTHPPQQSTTYSILIKHIGELEQIMANLIQDNKHLKESDELLTDLAEARKKKKNRHDSSETPPGSPPHQPRLPPSPVGPSRTSGSPEASRSSQLPPPPPPPPPSTSQSDHPSVSLIPEDLHMDDDMALNEQVHLSDDEDIKNSHIPKVNLQQDWWKPLKEDKPATSKPAWSILSSVLPVPKNNWASALASTYTLPPENSLLVQTGDMTMFMDWHNVSKPLPLGGPPGQMWIEEECKYDIAAMYGISHWWFQIQGFYIDRHTSEGDRRAVRTHMRILSVVRIEVFSMHGYDYMKNIILCRADLNEHIIAKKDFKYLYPSNFEDLHLVIRQRIEDFQLGIESYQTQLYLTKPRWDATGFEYKHDFMIDEALDYQVKEFKVNRINPGSNTRWLSAQDSDHLNQNALLSLEPRDHPKNLIRALFHYACFFTYYEKWEIRMFREEAYAAKALTIKNRCRQ